MTIKKTFVLLEVIIAFALVSIATLPFFRYPFQHMQKELTTLFEMELENFAQNKITKLHEQLLQKKLSQSLIFGDQKQKSPMEINFVNIQLAPNISRTYEEKVFVTWEKQKISNDQKITVLVHFKVQYRKPNKKFIILEAESESIAQKNLLGINSLL